MEWRDRSPEALVVAIEEATRAITPELPSTEESLTERPRTPRTPECCLSAEDDEIRGEPSTRAGGSSPRYAPRSPQPATADSAAAESATESSVSSSITREPLPLADNDPWEAMRPYLTLVQRVEFEHRGFIDALERSAQRVGRLCVLGRDPRPTPFPVQPSTQLPWPEQPERTPTPEARRLPSTAMEEDEFLDIEEEGTLDDVSSVASGPIGGPVPVPAPEGVTPTAKAPVAERKVRTIVVPTPVTATTTTATATARRTVTPAAHRSAAAVSTAPTSRGKPAPRAIVTATRNPATGGKNCWDCGKPGHGRAQCPTPTGDFLCYGCGRHGVTMRTCPRCSESWSKSGPYVPALGGNVPRAEVTARLAQLEPRNSSRAQRGDRDERPPDRPPRPPTSSRSKTRRDEERLHEAAEAAAEWTAYWRSLRSPVARYRRRERTWEGYEDEPEDEYDDDADYRPPWQRASPNHTPPWYQ